MSCIRDIIYYFCYLFKIQYKTHFFLEKDQDEEGKYKDNYITSISGTIKFLRFNYKIEQNIGLILNEAQNKKVVKVFIPKLNYTGNKKITNTNYIKCQNQQ